MIRRARRGGREARGNEEKERMRKGAIVSSSPQFEEENKEHRHLPLLISSRHCVSSEFGLDSAVKRCSSEVVKFSFQRSCSVKGLS